MRKITTPLKGLLLGSLALAMLTMSSGCTKMRTRLENEKLGSIREKYDSGWAYGARQDLTGFLELHEENVLAWVLRGNIMSESNEYLLAFYAYQRALMLDDGVASIYVGFGVIFSQNGDFERAVIHYEKALDLDPYDPLAMTSLAAVYLRTQQFDKAIFWGERAFETDAKNPLIMANLCIAYHFKGEYAKREELYLMAKQHNYHRMEGLDQVISGELRIFPEETEAELAALEEKETQD